MTSFPIPIERCELLEPRAVVVNDERTGLFALVDIRVPQADLALLADQLRLSIGLSPQLLPPPADLPHLPAARDAARLRATIAEQITQQTRAHLATARKKLAVVAAPAASGSTVTTPDTIPKTLSTTAPPPPHQHDHNTGPDLSSDRPHTARAYDYMLGGKTNYHADRLLYEDIARAFPTVRLAALSNRAFMHRAMRYLTQEGIAQFLDIGTGIPTKPNLHQVVQAVNPAARVVYVDSDPLVLAHAAALMVSTSEGRTTYIQADAREPDAIVAADELQSTLDLSRPVAISILAVLHFLDDDDAEHLVHTLLNAVPAGSALVLSHSTLDCDERGIARKAMAAYQAAGIQFWPRSHDQITRKLLRGLDVIDPGIVSTHRWRPDDDASVTVSDAEIAVHAVVARLPRQRLIFSQRTTPRSGAAYTSIPSATDSTISGDPTSTVRSTSSVTESPSDHAPVDLQTDRPHSARMYDYWLGGKNNFEADRVAAETLVAVFPSMGLTARSQREFIHRSTRYLARQGIDQFLDIGTGIPTEPNLHQIAQAVNPHTRVVYVDNDPIVLAHARALMTSTPQGRTTYIQADAHDPAAILADDRLRSTLDLSRPVAISTVGLLHFFDGEDAHRLVHTLLAAVPSGSALALTQVTGDAGGDAIDKVQANLRAAGIPFWYRTRAEVERLFLNEVEVVDPGTVFAHRWRPEKTLFPFSSDTDIANYGAVARKP